MDTVDLENTIRYLTESGARIAKQYTELLDVPVDYVAIYSHSDSEYEECIRVAKQLGDVVHEIPTGTLFKLHTPLITNGGTVIVLKVRKPDSEHPERGCVDFRIANYPSVKYNFEGSPEMKLVDKYEYEMLEVRKPDTDVLVYFPSLSFIHSIHS